jgi:hypothetical protein
MAARMKFTIDTTKDYLKKEQTELSPDGYKAKERDLNE